jgi:hypothetical protein
MRRRDSARDIAAWRAHRSRLGASMDRRLREAMPDVWCQLRDANSEVCSSVAQSPISVRGVVHSAVAFGPPLLAQRSGATRGVKISRRKVNASMHR